jgi:hypothetical protein
VKDIQELEGLLAAKMPIVAIESREEAKLLQMFERFTLLNERSLWTWSVTSGLKKANGLESAFNTTRIEDALRHIEKSAANVWRGSARTAKAFPAPRSSRRSSRRSMKRTPGRKTWTTTAFQPN